MWWKKAREARRESGRRRIPPPKDATDELDAVLYYVSAHVDDFVRTRRVAKTRAKDATVTVATLTTAVTVCGAAIGVTHWAWLGIVTALLGGSAAVVQAWDTHFDHKRLWIQRSAVLAELQTIERIAYVDIAAGTPRHTIAAWARERLESALALDVTSWERLHGEETGSAAGAEPGARRDESGGTQR